MKYILFALALMVVLAIGIISAFVEIYRIDMDSYNTRMAAFYHEVFAYMNQTGEELNFSEAVPL